MHDDSLVDPIRSAVVARSSHTTQPWVFRLGCALENLVIAAENTGAHATLEYFPDEAGTAATREGAK